MADFATALWFPHAHEVELRREQLPQVGADEVRVRTEVSGLSHGTEMLVYRGQVSPELGLDLPTLRGSFQFPIKYGYASVGRVVETGRNVEHLEVGELVFVHHPHQTEYVVPASMLIPLPHELGPETGVLYANTETAVNVLLDAHPRFGEYLVIFGMGVVGLLVTQLAKRAGAARVIAVDPAPQRRALARRIGADVVLSPDKELPEIVRSMTRGQGADIVIEASGSPAALAQAIDCVVPEGTVVVCSWYGTKPVTLPLGGTFHRGRIRLMSSQVGSIDPCLSARWSRSRRAAWTLELLSQLQLHELVTHRIPFARAAEAYTLVDSHADETVQVILTYGENDV